MVDVQCVLDRLELIRTKVNCHAEYQLELLKAPLVWLRSVLPKTVSFAVQFGEVENITTILGI